MDAERKAFGCTGDFMDHHDDYLASEIAKFEETLKAVQSFLDAMKAEQAFRAMEKSVHEALSDMGYQKE